MGWRHKRIVDVQVSSRAPLIVFDPDDAPVVAYVTQEIAPAYPNAEFQEVPGAGHNVLRRLLQKGDLKNLFLSWAGKIQ